MKIAVYSFQVDYPTRYSDFNPLLLFAQKYVFAPREQCPLRICYTNAIILVESGQGTLRLNNHHYQVQAGSLVYIPAGTVHQWISDSSNPMIHRCAYFDWKYVERPGFQYQRDYFHGVDKYREELISPFPQLEIHEVTSINNIPLWISYFNALTPPPELLCGRNSWDFLKYNGAFQAFLHQFLAFAVKHNVIYDPRIKKILDSIEKEPLKLDVLQLYEWAQELGLGKSRFHDLFKQDTGYSPSDYLNRLKYHHIAEDLCFSHLSITEIADRYGFSSIHYFSKAFRHATGMSPSEYRDKHRALL